MGLEQQHFATLLAAYQDLKLVSEPEVRETLSLFDPSHPLSATLDAADSLHVHIKVDDTANLASRPDPGPRRAAGERAGRLRQVRA